jgi:hypothetical protein
MSIELENDSVKSFGVKNIAEKIPKILRQNCNVVPRKYETKLRDITETVIANTYDTIIPEVSQFENIKLMSDKIDDIFDHTDAKVR